MSTTDPTSVRGDAAIQKPRPAAAKLEKTKTPGVFRKGNRYVVTFRDHEGRQRKESHRTYAEACEAKGKRNGGDRRPVAPDRFNTYAAEWLDTYRGRTKRGLSDSTRAAYRDSIERLAVPFFGRRKLAEIDRRTTRAFIAHLEASGQSAGSIQKHFTPVRAMFATAYEDELIPTNPAAVAVIVQNAKPRRRPPTPTRDQFPKLVAALPAREGLLAVLIGSTGLRISEALGLEIRDLHLDDDEPWIHVERQFYRAGLGGKPTPLKTDAAERVVHVPASLAAALAEHVAAHGYDVVFCTRDGRHLGYRNVLRVLHKALDDAGMRVPGFGFHALRRMAASFFEASARTDSQIAAILGHADGGRLARSTYLRAVDGTGGALPDNVVTLPLPGQREGNATPGQGRNTSAG